MRRKTFIGHLFGTSVGLGFSAGGLLAGARVANAAVGGLPAAATHADSSPEWEKLRESLFQSRPVDSQGESTDLRRLPALALPATLARPYIGASCRRIPPR